MTGMPPRAAEGHQPATSLASRGLDDRLREQPVRARVGRVADRSRARRRTGSAPTSASSSARSGSRRPARDPVGRAVGGRLRAAGRRDPRDVRLRAAASPSAGERTCPARPPTSTSSGCRSRSLAQRARQLVAPLDPLRRARRSPRRRRRRRAPAGRARARPRRPRHREPLEDRVLGVAQDEERDRRPVGDGAPEGGDRVLGRALADDADDRADRAAAICTPTAAARPKPSPPPAPK